MERLNAVERKREKRERERERKGERSTEDDESFSDRLLPFQVNKSLRVGGFSCFLLFSVPFFGWGGGGWRDFR